MYVQERNSMVEEGKFIDSCLQKHGKFLIPILQEIQQYYNYLPEEMLRTVAEKMHIPFIDVYGVATFYQSFNLAPKGEHTITVCTGTACYIRGGPKIVEAVSRELKIEAGKTTDDMEFTLETVNCLGCCAIGPTVIVDGEYYGEMTAQKTLNLLRSLKEEKKKYEQVALYKTT